MNLYRILKHGSSKQIKKIMTIFTIISAILLGITGYIYIKDFIIEKNWYKTEAVVEDYDSSDSSNVWTELRYEYNEEDYKTKIKGHSYYMNKNSKVEVYVNPNNPSIMKISNYLYALAKTIFVMPMIIIGIIVFIMLPIYIKKKKIGE